MYKIIKPPLQELSGEKLLGATANRDSGARLDVVADGFWGTSREKSYFDVRVFNPYAISNRQSSLSSTYRSHEKEKKRLYLQRIRDVEHSSFSPLLLVEWGKKLRSFTNAWPLSSLKSMGKLIVPQWPG